MPTLLDFGRFVGEVMKQYVTLVTGSALIGLIALAERLGWIRPIPNRYYGWLLVVFIGWAMFLAWRVQYQENESAREIGTLAFVGVGGNFNKHGATADIGLEIRVKNLQSRLMKYRVQRMRLETQGHTADVAPAGNSGFIYAGNTNMYRSGMILKNIELPNTDRMDVTLDYTIAYQVVGSSREHHSSKKLRIEFDWQTPTPENIYPGGYTVLEEHED